MSDISDFLAASERFKTWCQTALALWHERAADPRGGYAEFLEMDGRANFDHVRRVRVQARQAYVYAHAAHMGWYDDAKLACDQAWDFLTGPGFAGGDFIPAGPKGCAHLVNGDGSMHNDLRDSYAQAFVLLSGAWRYRAFDDKRALSIADDTLDFLDRHVKAGNGGWLESLPLPESPVRRTNPHMHLFESFLALYEATQERRYLSKADDMFALFKAHFFDAKTGGIIEFFNPDWSPAQSAAGKDGGPLEPGHMMEWCWILRQYERLSGTDVSAYANGLFDGALKTGLNEKLGLLCNAVHFDGSSANPNLRTWPQTELIKASCAQVMAGQDDKLGWVTRTINAMFDTYLNVAVHGGWADELDPDGNIISQNMPTSTFYHMFCAAADVDALSRHLKEPTI